MYYVGLHSTNNLEDGYFGSGTRIRRSVNLHGRTKHTMQILEYLQTREALLLREEQIVNSKMLSDPLCMNILRGGGTNYCSPSIGNAQRGKHVSDESRRRMSEAAKRRTDRHPLSEQTKVKMSLAKKGKPKTLEHRQKISEVAKAIRDEEWSKKMSIARGSACTIDGVTIYPSKRALAAALGFGKTGIRNPNFKFI